MNSWIRAIQAELLRLKRTLAIAVAIAAPALVSALYVLYLLNRKVPAQPPPEAWVGLMRLDTGLWSFLMLPLLIALQAALLNQQDHGEGLARVFFTLPVPRARIFLARLVVTLGLLALSSLVLWFGCLGGGAFLRLVKPGLGFDAPVPLLATLRLAFAPLAAGLFLVGLHHWLSNRFAGIALALGIGIGGTVANVLVVSSERWGRLFPWSLPTRIANAANPDYGFLLPYSAACLVVLALLGSWEATRREAG
jgi:hypothetical protein